MKIKGHFGQLTPKGVYGWAMDEESLKPIDIFLFVNGKRVARGLANGHRPNIQAHGIHPTGNCGFQFKFEDLDLPEAPNYQFEVKAGPQQQSFGRKIFALGRISQPEASESPYVFLHVQKTAGTSLNKMLAQLFSENEVFANRARMAAAGERYPEYEEYLKHAHSTETPPRLWVGHIPYITAQYLAPQQRCFTFLRDPVARAVSHLTYRYQVVRKQETISLETYYEQIKKQELWNLQSRFFADTDINRLSYFGGEIPMDEQGLATAKQQLSQCAFIGLTAHFNESIQLLAQRFNWQFHQIRRDNVTPKKPTLPAYILKEIEENVAFDQKLYHFALTKFKQQLPPIT